MTETVDLDSAISSAFEGVDTTAPAGTTPAQGTDAQPIGAGQTAEQIGSVPLSDKTLEQLSATGDKRRAPDGKFTKGEPVKADGVNKTEPVQAQPVAPSKPLNAPSSWSAQAKAEWAKLPPAIQAEVNKREADFHKGLEERTKSIGEKGKVADEFLEAARPYEAIMRAEGATPIEAFKTLLNTAYILRVGSPEQKLAAVRDACQRHGVDPRGLIGEQQEVHPVIAGLQNEIAQLKQMQQARIQQEAEAQSQTIGQAVTSFQNATDENGNPKYPHFEAVRKHMAAILPTLPPNLSQQEALQKAYEQAVRANPDTWELLQADMQAKSVQQRADQEREERAKRAGLSVRGAPNGASAARAARPSIDEAVDSAFAAVGMN